MTLFDTYIAVDWSANATPKHGADSIWIALRSPDVDEAVNIGTRAAATALLRHALLDAAARGRRTFVGWDFPLGYPSGTAGALGGDDWRDVWARLARITDGDRNENDRVALASALNTELTGRPAPFWGCPDRQATPTLNATKAHVTFPVTTRRGFALQELRVVERRIQIGRIRPKSVWQLGGAGSVGSQALLGIPRVRELREHPRLAGHSVIWPFETAFAALPDHRPLTVHAEIWPTEWLPVRSTTEVNDRAQVRAVVDGLAAADAAGALAPAFLRPAGVSDREIDDALNEEAWMISAHVIVGNAASMTR